MSSNSTGRYQSKVLSFIAQQFNRWGERHDRAIRHLKVATVWSAQVLLYPIYALFQTARLAGKQLQPPVEQERPQLSESASQPQKDVPPPETHIQQVLEIARRISQSENAVKGNETGIRGVACAIATKTLVLTGDRGEILDILTPQQQQQLQRRILSEEASYWSHRRSAIAPSPAEAPTLPPAEPRTDIWLPVRVFLNVMTWMQIGPVALAVNLFQEAAIALQPREQESQIDVTARERSAAPPTPPSPNLPIPAPLSSPSPRDWLQQVQNFGVALVSDAPGTALPTSDRADTFGIQSLIKAAVDYFFAETGEKLPPTAPVDDETDPWLSSGALFGTGSTRLQISAAEPAPSVLSLPSSSLPDLQVGQSLRSTVARSLEQPTEKTALSQPAKSVKSPQKVAAQKPTQPAATAATPAASTHLQATPQSSDVQHAPDWIEAKAYSAGYVKHPLEVVLEWVDSALLWLEKLIVEFMRWVQQVLGSRGW